jgi:hypothetical protein
MKALASTLLLTTAILAAPAMAQPAPTNADFMRALEKSLLKLRPAGFTERQVLFSNVQQGRSSGASYPFQADVVIRDYGPGYPANRYYGETCIGRMSEARFNLVKDDFGGWVAQGALTPKDSQCSRNPSEGVSAVPLASLSGTAAPASTAKATGTAPSATSTPSASSAPASTASASLRLGEYACFGRNGIVMAGMGFKLAANGRYTDVDGKRPGRYAFDAASGAVSFTDGHLGGQSAKVSGGGSSIRFTNMVSCEPWGR